MTKGNPGSRFSTEVRARAVRMVLENEADYKSRSQALAARNPDRDRLTHHSDRGVQSLSIKYRVQHFHRLMDPTALLPGRSKHLAQGRPPSTFALLRAGRSCHHR